VRRIKFLTKGMDIEPRAWTSTFMVRKELPTPRTIHTTSELRKNTVRTVRTVRGGAPSKSLGATSRSITCN
jgi:hypothetical protein